MLRCLLKIEIWDTGETEGFKTVTATNGYMCNIYNFELNCFYSSADIFFAERSHVSSSIITDKKIHVLDSFKTQFY